MNEKICCLFTGRQYIKGSVKRVFNQYPKVNKVIVVEETENPDNCYCVFKIVADEYDKALPYTIIVHRKGTVLYTINGLNELIKSINGGILDKTLVIPWDNYENCLVVTDNEQNLKIVKTNLWFVRKNKNEKGSKANG